MLVAHCVPFPQRKLVNGHARGHRGQTGEDVPVLDDSVEDEAEYAESLPVDPEELAVASELDEPAADALPEEPLVVDSLVAAISCTFVASALGLETEVV